MSAAIETLEIDPIKVEPRPCGYCGLKIDRHRRVDEDEGPEFLCLPPPELDMDELQLRADLIRQIEIAEIARDMEMNDPRDHWRHTGDRRLTDAVRNSDITPLRSPRIKQGVPQATVDAFGYMIRCEPERLDAWLRDHAEYAVELLATTRRATA